jgi:hypothetical protein
LCNVHVEEEERLHLRRLDLIIRRRVGEHRAVRLATRARAAVGLVADDQRLTVVAPCRRVPDLEVRHAGDPQVAGVLQLRVAERAALPPVHGPDRDAVAARARRAQDLAQDHARVVAADVVGRGGFLELARLGVLRRTQRDLDHLDARGRWIAGLAAVRG